MLWLVVLQLLWFVHFDPRCFGAWWGVSLDVRCLSFPLLMHFLIITSMHLEYLFHCQLMGWNLLWIASSIGFKSPLTTSLDNDNIIYFNIVFLTMNSHHHIYKINNIIHKGWILVNFGENKITQMFKDKDFRVWTQHFVTVRKRYYHCTKGSHQGSYKYENDSK